jgi:hypothetical protein
LGKTLDRLDGAKIRQSGEHARQAGQVTVPDVRILLLWFLAVSDAEKGDRTRLIKLLRSDFGMQRRPRSGKEWLRWQGVHAAEQMGRDMLAVLLEQPRLTKKRGGQMTPLFRLSAKDRLARAAALARRFQRGEAMPISDLAAALARRLPPEQRRKIEIKDLAQIYAIKAKPMSADKAIDLAAKMFGVADLKLLNFMSGKTGFGRGRPSK